MFLVVRVDLGALRTKRLGQVAPNFMDFLLIAAILVLLGWLAVAQEVFRGNRRMRRLATLQAPAPAVWPRVSVVFAARNEAATVGAAVPTMLALDYPDLEIIAVNDRSEDGTGAILDRLAATDPRLKVVHVTELPAGWLGKNHALADGSQVATGEWILFTDADIHFRPDVLRRAVAHARANSLDHLAAIPALQAGGTTWLGICVAAFSLVFALFIRPWRVIDPTSRCHGGIGAFNLVRTSTYRKMGGHVPLHLRPDDDLKLGKLMKSGGFSEIIHGAGALSVSWYPTVGEMIRGLEKNAFAGTDYRLSLILAGVVAHAVGVFWPLVALFCTAGEVRWCYAAAVAVMLLLAADHQRFDGGKWWHGLFLPAGIVVLDYAIVRSTMLTLWRRGIIWRGTFYSLRELKENRL